MKPLKVGADSTIQNFIDSICANRVTGEKTIDIVSKFNIAAMRDFSVVFNSLIPSFKVVGKDTYKTLYSLIRQYISYQFN